MEAERRGVHCQAQRMERVLQRPQRLGAPLLGFETGFERDDPARLVPEGHLARCSFSIRCAVRTSLSDRHGRKSTTSLRKRGSRVSAHSCRNASSRVLPPASTMKCDSPGRRVTVRGLLRPLVRIDSLMSSNFAFVARRGLCS